MEKLFTKEATPSDYIIKKVESKIESKLTNNQKKILALISKNPNMILAELSEKIGISVTSVSNNLKKLTEKGIIKRIGADKNGYWQINSKK